MNLHEACLPASEVEQKIAAAEQRVLERVANELCQFGDGGAQIYAYDLRKLASRLTEPPKEQAPELPTMEDWRVWSEMDGEWCNGALLDNLAKAIVEGKAEVVLKKEGAA